MLKHVLSGTIAALVLTTSSVLAKDAPMPAPAIPAEVAQVAYFVGTWHCSGKGFAMPMSPEHATTGTVHAAMAAGGRWLHTTYDEDKTAANPTPYHIGLYTGYDSAKKQFAQSSFDTMGGYATQTGTGWNGDVMVFEGSANGMPESMGVRDTFTKKGASEFMHTGEMQGADKKWMKTDEETCKKGK